MRWDWYDPMGNLYDTTGEYTINSDGRLRDFNTSWHKIAIKGDEAANLPGKWQVKVYLDNKQITTRQFEIKGVSVAKEDKLPSLRPDTYAIIIGIDYRGSKDISPLKYPSQDAKKMYEVLTDVRYGGVPKENTRLLINEQANRNTIITALNKIKSWDGYIYVYYSGHGAPKIENERMTDALLVPHDIVITDPDTMENTAIPVSYLQKLLDSSQAKGVMVALDACFTGSGNKSIMAKGGKPLVGMIAPANLIKPQTPNKIIIASSDANQQSWEDDVEIKGGIFSYYLLEGLKGKAGRDIWIKADDIAEYVKATVPVMVKKLKGDDQNPSVSGRGDFAVARNLERERYLDKMGSGLRYCIIIL